MKKIKMVDLQLQYEAIKEEIDKAVQDVLDETAFINGPQVKQFTENLKRYSGSKHVIPCGNGTDALQIALMALDLEEGDEVLIPSFTYVATAEVAALLKLTPVFVDVDPHTFNIVTNDLEEKITKRSKAIVPVHLYGQCANMEEIIRIAQKFNLYLIEDTAQAIGAEYVFANGESKYAGTIGDFGTLSFFPSKNLGCYGDGGAILTQNDTLAEKARMIANHGQSQKYIFEITGCNSRLDTLQAAILDIKLKYLNQYIWKRQKVADFYDQAFNDIEGVIPPYRSYDSTHVFHQYTIKVANGKRDELKSYLKDHDVPSMIYYPVPLHRQKAFVRFGNDRLQVSEELCGNVLSLPIHTEMDGDQMEHIISTLKKFF